MRKKQYIGIGCIVVAVICIILFGVKIIGSEPNVNQHSKTPISRKYKKDQVTTLTAEKSVLNLYLTPSSVNLISTSLSSSSLSNE